MIDVRRWIQVRKGRLCEVDDRRVCRIFSRSDKSCYFVSP